MLNIIKFDKKVECATKYVAVRIIDNCDELKVGSIYLPSTASANDRLAHAVVESVGPEAADKYGLAVGDHVMIDRLSTFYRTYPVAMLAYNNVIVKTNEAGSEYFPLKGMLFVEPDKKEAATDVGGIIVPNYADKLNIGTITKMDCVMPSYKVGDRVVVTKGGDVFQCNGKTVYIYKHDMIIATVKE